MNQDGGWGLQGTRAKLKVSTFPSLSILLVLLKERVAQEAGGVGWGGREIRVNSLGAKAKEAK